MKKLLYFLLALSLTLLISSHLLIPNEIVISEIEEAESSERILSKYLNGANERLKWWPQKNDAVAGDTLKYRNYSYYFQNRRHNSIGIIIGTENLNLKSTISWIPVSGNLYKLTWKTSLPAGINPMGRFLRYREARKVKADIKHVLERYLTFITNRRDVYGYEFKIETVSDTLLATTSFHSVVVPNDARIYQAIDHVKTYIDEQGIKATNPPMLNISPEAQGYLTTVALPVASRFKSNGSVMLRRMVAGNILVTDVKGGPKAISNGFRQMETFIKDFKLSSPAIYFESLVTNRSDEPDTAKWITKIYYPIY